MRYANSQSFEYSEPDQIDGADIVEYLSSDSKNVVHAIKSGWETWACAWAPDNLFFAWSCGQRLVHLIPWDKNSLKKHDPSDEKGLGGRKYHILDCCETVWSLAFGSGFAEKEHSFKCYLRGRIVTPLVIATGHSSGKIKLWDCQTGCLIIELLDHKATVRCLEFTQDGSLQLLSASQDYSLKLWDLNNDGNMYHSFKAPGVKFFGCSFSPNGKWVVGVGGNRAVFLWTMSEKKEKPLRLNGHHNEVVSCSFSPDSAILATAAFDTKIILWNMDTFKQMRVLGHLFPSPSLIFAGGANDHYVRSVSFSPNSSILGSVCDDSYIRMWNLSGDYEPVSIVNVEDGISCKFSAGGGVMAVGCRNGDVYFLSTPVRVASLKKMVRIEIRKQISSTECDELPLPTQIIKFLKYEDFIV